MSEKKFDAQVNYGWGLSLNMTGKAPAVAKRIFDTYADALAYANDVNDSAIEGLVLSVVADTDDALNGVYFVQQAASKAVEANEAEGIEAADAKEAILVKLGSADAADNGAADALKQAKDYTDTEVGKLANGSVSANTKAIATLNGDANTDGSVAKAVATEQDRALVAEKANADAITAEIAAREAAITALNADVTSEDGDYVTVKVTEVGGVITAVNVTESGIASAQELATEKKSREDADNAINDKIGTVGTVTTIVEMINAEAERATKAESDLAKRVTANETSINTLKGDAATEGSVAYAVAAETTRAQDVESGLDSRLDTVEGDENKVGSIKKALADAKTYADTKIDGLDSTKTGEGTFVDVTVAQENGVITSVTVAESDIASATVLAEVKKDVDNFFKDADFVGNAKDTLRELQEYINTDAAGALAMEQAIANNKTAIEAEVARAEAAESGLTADIEAEADRAKAAESGLTDAIAAATVVAENSEFITIEQTGEVGKTQTYTIKTQDIASSSDLATEISRAQEAEQGNSDAIDSIKSDYLKSSDKLELSQAIVSETEARIQAISNLEFKNSLKLDGVVQSEELLTTLPDVQSGALYSVGPDSNDRYKLYAYVNGSWTYMGYLNSSSIDITQSLGQSQNLAISQKAVTDALTPIIMTQAEFDALVSNGTITDDDLTIRYIID